MTITHKGQKIKVLRIGPAKEKNMSKYVIGIKRNGERIRFEDWVYDAWRKGLLNDRALRAELASCVCVYHA